MKRLSFAASVAATFILLTNSTPSQAIGIDTATSPLARTIAISARGVASSMGSVGYCFRGVKQALKRVGFTLVGGEAFMAKNQFAENPQFEQVALDDLHIGDILVHGASQRHPHGHIAVYLGEGEEASDHLGHLITGARYGGTTVWRVKPEIALQPAGSLDHSYDVDAGTTAEAKEASATAATEATQPLVTAQATATQSTDSTAAEHAEPSGEAVSEATATKNGEVNANAVSAEQPQTTVPMVSTTITVPSLSAAPKQQVDLTNSISAAMMQVVQMAQSAQINLTQALAEAVGALAS